MSENKRKITVREAARQHLPIDGADAQALEGALQQVERELTEANLRLAAYEKLFSGVLPGERAHVVAMLRGLQASTSVLLAQVHQWRQEAQEAQKEIAKLRMVLPCDEQDCSIVASLQAENAKLRECVDVADHVMRQLDVTRWYPNRCEDYDKVRKAVTG